MLELRKQEAPQRLYGHESYLVNCHKPAGSARSDFENLNFRLPASAIMPCKPSPIIVLSHLRHVRLFATPWTIAHQAPLSMGFSREEYWSGLPCPPPRHLTDPGIEPVSPMSPALAGSFFTTSATWEAEREMSEACTLEYVSCPKAI